MTAVGLLADAQQILGHKASGRSRVSHPVFPDHLLHYVKELFIWKFSFGWLTRVPESVAKGVRDE